jgi:hypothetical protein
MVEQANASGNEKPLPLREFGRASKLTQQRENYDRHFDQVGRRRATAGWTLERLSPHSIDCATSRTLLVVEGWTTSSGRQ